MIRSRPLAHVGPRGAFPKGRSTQKRMARFKDERTAGHAFSCAVGRVHPNITRAGVAFIAVMIAICGSPEPRCPMHRAGEKIKAGGAMGSAACRLLMNEIGFWNDMLPLGYARGPLYVLEALSIQW